MATADNAADSLRSGRPTSALPHFKLLPKNRAMTPRLPLLIVLPAMFIQGCRTYEIRSPATLIPSATAVYSKREGNSVSERVVGITPIKRAVSRSTWHSGAFLDKGSVHLKFKDSPDLFVSFYGNFFWIEGQPGFYRIRKDDEEEFLHGMRRILRE